MGMGWDGMEWNGLGRDGDGDGALKNDKVHRQLRSRGRAEREG